jgi:uncharacterized membrane protein
VAERAKAGSTILRWARISRSAREFNRFWTRLEIEADARNRVTRPVLRHRGESLPLGEGLPQHERAAIARELRRALAAGNAR